MKNNIIYKIYLESINFVIFANYNYDNCKIIKYPLIDPITNYYHFDIRFNDKERNPYSLDIIKSIINKGINKFNSDKNYYKYHNNILENKIFFSLESKTYNLINN